MGANTNVDQGVVNSDADVESNSASNPSSSTSQQSNSSSESADDSEGFDDSDDSAFSSSSGTSNSSSEHKKKKLWPTVTEKVVFKDSWNSSRKRRWESSGLKPKRLLVNCNPVVLFQEIEKEYNAGSAAKNDILIKREMFSRKLVKGERVDTYIDAVMRLQEDLVTLGFPLEDSELARLLLTNALEVFPDLSNELVAAHLKRSALEVGRVRGRLLAREQEENMRGPIGSRNTAAANITPTLQQNNPVLQSE
ncbi:gag-polypeptide of LTR copia-type [Phytophthora infestans]|uniref:Gag-polypeptide of LTR copia-type n=1 Tax=Phytophthora infestans TaxID=4787 RepID=A0A833T615_PHYIN|nr:gag-polypeptide of LTR copia-type [Phytophthora infestans]